MAKELGSHFLAAPSGFVSVSKTLNRIVSKDAFFRHLVHSGFAFVCKKKGAVLSATELVQGYTDIDTSLEVLQSCVNGIVFVARNCMKFGESEDQIRQVLAENTILSNDVIHVIAESWQRAKEYEHNEANNRNNGQLEVGIEQQLHSNITVNMGRLVGLEWKLGVAIQSKECSNLLTPYVQLLFKVVDHNGKITFQHLELTYSQFQDLSTTFRFVAAKLDTV